MMIRTTWGWRTRTSLSRSIPESSGMWWSLITRSMALSWSSSSAWWPLSVAFTVYPARSSTCVSARRTAASSSTTRMVRGGGRSVAIPSRATEELQWPQRSPPAARWAASTLGALPSEMRRLSSGGDRRANGSQDLVEIARLLQGRLEGKPLHLGEAAPHLRGHQDYGRAVQLGIAPELPEHFSSVHARQREIEQAQVGPMLADLRKALGAVGRPPDVEALQREAGHVQLARVLVVLDDQDAGGSWHPRCITRFRSGCNSSDRDPAPEIRRSRFGGGTRTGMVSEKERRVALFIDFENLVTNTGISPATFDLQPAMDRLLEKGKVVFRRAYCDWSRFREATRRLHEFGVELIDVPPSTRAGKNGADMRLVIDALELCYAREHIDTFAIASGDSDFCPLAYKLRENNRVLIGLGVKEATSPLFMKACDEFIYLKPPGKAKAASRGERPPAAAARKPRSPSVGRDIPPIAREVVSSLLARATGPLNPSLIKETIVRKEPDFDEREQGFSTFMRLLQEMERQGLLKRQQLNGRQWYVLPPDAAPSTPEAPHESSDASSEGS